MTTATWNNKVLAKSDKTIEVEGNQYFPPDAINKEYFKESAKTTTCPWKGEAHYFDVVVDGNTNAAAAWFYPDPKSEASKIKGYIAFWNGVQVK